MIKSSDCQASHIGETGRNLNTRLTEHKQATRNYFDVNNHIAGSSSESGCRNVSHQQKLFQNYPHLDYHTIRKLVLAKIPFKYVKLEKNIIYQSVPQDTCTERFLTEVKHNYDLRHTNQMLHD